MKFTENIFPRQRCYISGYLRGESINPYRRIFGKAGAFRRTAFPDFHPACRFFFWPRLRKYEKTRSFIIIPIPIFLKYLYLHHSRRSVPVKTAGITGSVHLIYLDLSNIIRIEPGRFVPVMNNNDKRLQWKMEHEWKGLIWIIEKFFTTARNWIKGIRVDHIAWKGPFRGWHKKWMPPARSWYGLYTFMGSTHHCINNFCTSQRKLLWVIPGLQLELFSLFFSRLNLST